MIRVLVFILGAITAVQTDSNEIELVDTTKGKSCIIAIGSKRNYILQWPLVFDQSGKLYETSTDDNSGEVFINVKSGEQIKLSCGPNYFKLHFKVEVHTATCNGVNGKFTVNDTEYDASELTCDLRVIEQVLDDVYGCVDSKSTAARFGYVDPNKQKTMLLGEVCYDMKSGKTLFVHIKLGDQASSHLEVLPKNYLTSHHHPDGRYKIELFRGLQFDDIYERIRATLHTRDIPALRLCHYIDETLLGSAQFQAIKKLGWNYFVGYDENETLEQLKRDIKRLSQSSNLDIYAGSYGVKQLKGENGEKIEIYLHEQPSKRFPMPRLLWFIVKQEEKATAFVVSNAAVGVNSSIKAAKSNFEMEDICELSDCSKVTWLSPDLKKDEKLICCDINDIRKTIKEIPVLVDVKKMLL